MGRLRAKTDYEQLPKARIVENQARLASCGVQKTVSELKSRTSSIGSEKTNVRKYSKADYSSTPLRRSSRLQGKPCNPEPIIKGLFEDNNSEDEEENSVNPDYEELRKARILENQARLASLGVQKIVSELKSITSPIKSEKRNARKYCTVDYSSTPLRRSSRLKGKSCNSEPTIKDGGLFEDNDSSEDAEENRPANAPLAKRKSSSALARRCSSRDRGTLYDPIYGICCHFCRQKKLCGEEDCKRCGYLDLDQPCIGKTDCSICQSSNGVLCRGCLKVRYGEELEEVRANKQWACPHCIEEKEIRPYWICNSSLCLKKRKMAPTGIAIFRAREMGYKSVADLLMAQLRKAEKKK